jgi:hypothetical protein
MTRKKIYHASLKIWHLHNKEKLMTRLFTQALIILALVGCSSPEEEAKELGFESVEQMQQLKARGYDDYNSYKEAKKLTPEFFNEECKKKPKDIYSSVCFGKKISWKGLLKESSGSDGASVDVLSSNKNNLEVLFSIDSKSLAEKVKPSDVDKIIEFDGTIYGQNIFTPDIEEIMFVNIESDSEKNQRLYLAKKERERIEAEAKKADEDEFNAHSSDAEWLQEKFGIAAAAICSRRADDYLRSTAKYNFQWDDIGWLETKFDKYYTNVRLPGILTVTSNKVALQNGFGAYVRVIIECDFNAKTNEVTEFRINQ